MPEILKLTLLLDVIPHQKLRPLPFLHVSPRHCFDSRLHIGKIVAFRQILILVFGEILLKFCGAYFQFHTHDLFGKVHSN